MKKKFWRALLFVIVVIIIELLWVLNGRGYYLGMEKALEKEYPNYIEVVKNFSIYDFNDKEFKEEDYGGLSKAEVIALENLYNINYSFKHVEKNLKQDIKNADPWGDDGENEKVLVLKGALEVVEDIKDKYYLKYRVIDILFTVGIFILTLGCYEVCWGKKRREENELWKDKREDEDYPSREFFNKPKV